MTSPPTLTAAILVVSDTASASPDTDATTAALRSAFEPVSQPCTWSISDTQIVPDDSSRIQDAVKTWCDKAPADDSAPPNLLLTAGGTGFATRDITPETVEPLLDKKAAGLV